MKFIIEHIFLIAIVVLSGGALLWPMLSMGGKRASPQEVTTLINRGKATIVDVRGEKEFAEGHLRDAKNIPLAELGKRIGELDKFKTRSIIVICQKGTRVAAAASLLAKAGFADVVGLEGGMAAWQKENFPVAK